MVVVLIFSFGVERGKRFLSYNKNQLKEEPMAPMVPAEIEQPLTEPKTEPKIEVSKKPEPEPPSPVSKPYTIQVATYWSKSNAKSELEKLKKKGYDSFIIFNNDKYELCAGEYVDKDDAEKSIKTLKKDYKDCFLRRR